MNNREEFKDDTYSLAKGLHHLEIARQYIDLVRISTKGSIKNIFNNYLNRCDWVLNDLRTRLSQKSRNILKEELSDSLCIDSINDNLIHLTNEQRLVIEKITSMMVKGEDIKFVKEDNVLY